MSAKMMGLWGAMKATPDGKGNLKIEGWANKAVVDDVGDLMTFEDGAIDFKRFDLNPIMFFNHDRNQPIGRWTERKVTPEGLFLKGVISASEVPEIKKIRDLVEEGMLNSLSIGYEEHDAVRNAEGVNVVTKWKLNEVSIVTLPANVEAMFTVSKALEVGDRVKAAKSLDEARKIIKACGEDPENNPDDKPKGDNEEDPKAPPVEPASGADDGGKGGGDPEPKGDPEGDDPTEPKEPPDGEPAAKADDEPGSEPKADGDAFQECVSAKIPKLVAEGKTQEQAVAIAIAMCSDGGKCALTQAGVEFALNLAKDSAAAHTQKEGLTAPMQNTLDTAGDGNPQTSLMQSQLAMLGQISNQLGAVLMALEKLVLVPPRPSDDNGEDSPEPEPMLNTEDLQEIVAIGDTIKSMVKGLHG